MLIQLLILTAIFSWGVWSYFHSDKPNSAAFVPAVVGLVLVVIVVVRALVS